MSDFFPDPVPNTKCPKSKNKKHEWTNKSHLYPDPNNKDKIDFNSKDTGYVIPHLFWCIHCKLFHQP